MNANPGARQRNWTLALIFAVTALNLFDRQIVNVLAQDIKAELRVSDASLGLLTGTAFGIFYSVMGIPLGRLGDRINRVKLIATVMVLWSGLTALCGFAGNFVQLFLARMGVGVGEAGSAPSSSAMIIDLFDEKQRTMAMSVFMVGAPVGSFLGLLIGGHVGSIWGWRAAFIVAAVPGLLLAPIVLFTMRDPRPVSPSRRGGTRESLPRALGTIVATPQLMWLTLGLTCSTFVVYAAGAWMPALLIRLRGMSTAEVGKYTAIAVGIGGVIGTLGGGFASDLLRAHIRRLTIVTAALALSIVTLLLTVFASDRLVILGSMLLFNSFAWMFLGPTATLIQDEATPESRALTIATCVAVSNVLNLGFGIPIIGVISDALKPRYGPEAIQRALALSVVAVGLIGVAAYWRARVGKRALANVAPVDTRRRQVVE